ncbi:MAG TPA: hypothetical protein VEE84_03025 [Burkholderiaceae bacterium]|nr:hypothetical protein [Burkholderiaceae bacterium]
MITFTKTANTDGARFEAALVYAREIAAHGKTLTGIDTRIEMPIGGPSYRLRWVSQYQSLAALERAITKLLSDRKYMDMAAKAPNYFVPGSATDEVWTSV